MDDQKKIYFPITIDELKAKNQKLITIEDIPIYFPYVPYEPQKKYMEKVISTLNQEGSISALESPTGTGKTLCLLCSVLAWAAKNKKEISIYYCTRTVSQINNVLKELNQTCYKLIVSFFASRKHTCINFSKSEKKQMDYTKLNDICDNIRKRKKKSLKNEYIKINFEEEEEEEDMDEEDEEEEEKELKKEKNSATHRKNIENNSKEEQKSFCLKEPNSCIYYRPKFFSQISLDIYKDYNELEDIEDLLKKGKTNKFCPYFYNMNKTKKCANLTIMTYNYILNPFIRKRLKIIKSNSIVLLDEAHNICNILENLFTWTISIDKLEKIQELFQIIMDFINEYEDDSYSEGKLINKFTELDTKEINQEITIIKNFIKYTKECDWDKINECKKIDSSKNIIYNLDLDYLKKLFKSFNFIIYCKMNFIFNNLDKPYIDELIKYSGNKDIEKSIILLNKFYEFLFHLNKFGTSENSTKKDSIPFESNLPQLNENTESFQNNKAEEINDKNKEGKYYDNNSFRFIFKKTEKKMNFEIICIDASYGFKSYLNIKPYSTILTSGTLSINSLENLLNISFYEKLNNEHVLDKSQFIIDIIRGYENNNSIKKFSFNYKNRENVEQIKILGNQIYNYVNSVKVGGVLVFFQSYEYLNKCYNIWIENKTIKKLLTIKEVIFDINSNKESSEELITKSKKNHNLLLFTVYRGRNSEGINFPNDEARMVICVGMPYPNLSDPKVIFKRDFLDKRKRKFDGDEWYREEAMNAVNQSLGRLLRNKNDYGIMICIGIEFYNNEHKLSKWIRNNKKQLWLKENNKTYFEKLEQFLDNLRKKFPPDIFNRDNRNESSDDSNENDYSDDDDNENY